MERKESENVSDFTLGEENVVFAPYFIGKSYLSLLNDKEVVIYNVTFGEQNENTAFQTATEITWCPGAMAPSCLHPAHETQRCYH